MTPGPDPEDDSNILTAEDPVARVLELRGGAEFERFDGWRPDPPGRGVPVLPPFVDGDDDTSLHGRVTFTRFLGGYGVAHGGTPPLLFDDVLDRVVNHHHDGVARTAFLNDPSGALLSDAEALVLRLLPGQA